MLDNLDPREPKDEYIFSYRLKGARLTEYFRRYRYMLLKAMVDQSRFSEVERMELFFLRDSLYGVKDRLFINKHYKELKTLNLIFISEQNGFDYSKGFSKEVIMIILRQENLGLGHDYYGNYSKIGEKSLLVRFPVNRRKYRVPKRYIGVGYRDKGNMKNKAKDGTPCWQEVCSALRSEEETELQGWQKRAFVSVYGGFYRMGWNDEDDNRNRQCILSRRSTSQEFYEITRRK
jgi:hypothetical protein